MKNEHQEQKHPYFGAPPAKTPRPAADEPTLRGKRVILSMPDGFVYDMRAVSEVGTTAPPTVDIVTEEDYYRWMFTGRVPDRSSFPVRLVWVEG